MVVIRSGAQTGVDRGALDGALSVGLPVRGWIPKGRLAYTPIPESYDQYLTEMTDALFPALIDADEETIYCLRTEQNAKDGDGSLVFIQNPAEYTHGTKMTVEMAEKHGKPYFIVNLTTDLKAMDEVANWIIAHGIKDLNVGGPNEKKSPGIYEATRAFIKSLLLHPKLNVDTFAPSLK